MRGFWRLGFSLLGDAISRARHAGVSKTGDRCRDTKCGGVGVFVSCKYTHSKVGSLYVHNHPCIMMK